jgi:uncharacterized protein with GYD domain
MPKYIGLINYTQQGIENVKDSPNRFDAFKKLCKSMGANVDAIYLTMGRYDLVVIVDAPDSEVIAKIMLTTASKGSASTETLQAFTEEEYRRIMAALP